MISFQFFLLILTASVYMLHLYINSDCAFIEISTCEIFGISFTLHLTIVWSSFVYAILYKQGSKESI